jgi:Polyketide cyclase / dehydrase and lipid transport
MQYRRRLLKVGILAGAGATLYQWLVKGALTLDTGIGRTHLPLGPIETDIAADAETTFEVIAAPYLGKTPQAMEEKFHVLERGTDMVLAEHFTEVGNGMKATTMETVRFERPNRIYFRLVRGPVPEVTEIFDLEPSETGTAFTYTGTLGTDFWGLGEAWGRVVARKWEQAVRESVDGIKSEAERRAKTQQTSA